MEDRFRKKSSAASDIPSPVLLRRRLSAPETIMRKHMLAQQRSESQDSDVTQASDVRSCQWRMETGIGSDPNLNRKRDHGLMRKSTLMRRLWGANKPLSERSCRLSGSYYDWQYGRLSQGRSTQSLCSTHSSPEHLKYKNRTVSLNNEEFKTSPVHKKYESLTRRTNGSLKSVRNQVGEYNRIYNNGFDHTITTKHKLSVMNGNLDVQSTSLKTSCCSNYTYATSFENPTSSVESRLSTSKTPTMTTTETESEHYSTRSTSTTGTTTFSDNSDSAYTNSHSNFTQTSTETSSVGATTFSSERFVEENGNIGETENANQYGSSIKDKKECADNKTTSTNSSRTHVTVDNQNDSSTQTVDSANLNVISNVQLSQSTLNLIFNKVMQDVQKSPSTNINISTISASIPLQSNNNPMPQPKVIKVQQVPSFYLKQKEEQPVVQESQRGLKYMVSNVGTGSPYSKPSETPQVVVPRFSALPRTTSMEVNTSSGESTDKESDNISLVDSLEDPSSPRVDINQNTRYDDRPVRGDLSPLLPDNSTTKSNKTSAKASVFFIPIESNIEADTKSVADHLPEKVRERLSKRQLKREQKLKQTKDKIISPKSDSNYVSASDNGNLQCAVDNAKYVNNANRMLPDIHPHKSKRKSKPMLPSIELIRKNKTDSKGTLKHMEAEKNKDKKLNKPVKRKSATKIQDSQVETSSNEKKQSHWMPKTRQKMLDRLSPLCATKAEYDVLPKRIYHKTELSNLNKRIEILEIVECIEAIPDGASHRLSRSSRNKSKIPILVHSKLPSISRNDKSQKPVFLDFDQVHEVEPKIDQLIANILIDALNKADPQGTLEEKQKLPSNVSIITEKRPPLTQSPQTRHQGNKYQQTFESIPEERTASLQSSSEDASNIENANDLPKDSSDEKNRKSLNSKTFHEDSTSEKRHSHVVSSRQSNGSSSNTKPVVPDGYKGKAALGIVKDENFSTIPKGWITFYTLHKSQGSPESTSDEGKKKYMGHEKTNNNGNAKEELERLKKLANFPDGDRLEKSKTKMTEIQSEHQNATSPINNNKFVVPSKESNLSQDSIDTWTSSDQERHMRVLHPLPATGFAHRNQQKKARHKNSDTSPPNKAIPGGWSVTVSGTTSGGQFAPDLEMRLTFPRGNKQNVPANHSDSGLGEENSKEKRENFPYLVPRKENNRTSRSTRAESSCTVQQLPQIGKNRSTKKLRQCESGHIVNVRDYIEPRQTRTSTRRLLLNRPRTFITPAEIIAIDTEDNNIREILERFPELLKITGNAISPERKPRVPTMSERDVTRHLYKPN